MPECRHCKGRGRVVTMRDRGGTGSPDWSEWADCPVCRKKDPPGRSPGGSVRGENATIFPNRRADDFKLTP